MSGMLNSTIPYLKHVCFGSTCKEVFLVLALAQDSSKSQSLFISFVEYHLQFLYFWFGYKSLYCFHGLPDCVLDFTCSRFIFVLDSLAFAIFLFLASCATQICRPSSQFLAHVFD